MLAHHKHLQVKRSVNISSPMSSPVVVVSPVPRPADFQAHVYNSFLQGRTSDVAIRIRGSWEAIYKFHRVVLIQAVRTLGFFAPTLSSLTPFEDYFRHLFTGGFIESEDKDSTPGSRVASGPIDVEFDDTNITRAGM
jgi:hypothetical protein